MLVTTKNTGETPFINNTKDRLISEQRQLIQLFDAWVKAIREADQEKAADIVKQSNMKRLEIANIEKTLKSKIILR